MTNRVHVPGRGAPGGLWLNALALGVLLGTGPVLGTPPLGPPVRSPTLPPFHSLPSLLQPNVQSVPLPYVGTARFDTDPLLFDLRCNKSRVKVGEEVELTVTVRYVNLSPTLRFLSEGATGYALKLLVPAGFEADENPLLNFARGRLSTVRPEQTFVVRGRFNQVPREAAFRLLRGPQQADTESILAEKAKLTLAVDGGETTARALRVAGATRQLIFNTGTERKHVRFAYEHHFTAVSFWEAWYNLNPSPGVYHWDSLRACFDLCRQLGLKAQVNVGLRRQRNTGGRPQDHEAFFPESDIVRFNDGSIYRYQSVADKFDVVPSFSSAQGMAALETFLRDAGAFLKPYFDDGTLLNVLAISGQDGEFNYPIDATPGNIRWSDYSQPTLQEYRNTYLPGRYGTIAALNRAWGTNIVSFAEVPYPFSPTPNDQYPGLDQESRRDWIRFGTRKIAEAGQRWRTALQSAAAIPFSYFASELTHYYYGVGFRATNIPVMAATLDGLYTSAGNAKADLEASKLAWLDVVKGTLGSGKIVEIEFDNDDLSIQPGPFTQPAALRDLGSRFFDKGGDYVHITQLGGFDWPAVEPHLKYLRDTYCTAPNNAVTARSPQATGQYNWTKTISNGNEPFAVWRSVGGASRQVDVRCVDDFIATAPPPAPPAPTPTPPAEIPCTRPAALVSDSPVTLGSALKLTGSYDGGSNEPNVTYQWVKPDGSTVSGQTYTFGNPANALQGKYTFKATHSSGAACLSVTLSADGVVVSP